jgi:murein DD-endopeptidase MepM/ murein hydrolase activator NlpD
MGLKHHTIIFVPHARARFRKFRVSSRRLGLLAASLIGFSLLSIFTTWSFLTNTIDRNEVKRIRAENEQLRQTNQSFEGSIRNLEKQLNEFEERTRKLAIVAGLDNLGEVGQAGIGGTSSSAYEETFGSLQGRAEELTSSLDQVEIRLDERDQWLSSMPWVAPVRGVLTSGFGYRRDPMTGQKARHQGVDISTSPGRPVQSPANGIIIQAGRIGGLGNAVSISHGYGVTTRYGHLSRIDVRPGQRIQGGEVLGLVGSSGKSTGYHLHYEVRVDGKSTDPTAYLLDWSS